MLVYNIYVLPGSAATHLRCGGNFNNSSVANCPQSVPVKELLKSINIWRRYGQKLGGPGYFMDHSVYKVGRCSFAGGSKLGV